MPNWCRGKLKVRGNKKNLIEFILKGLQPVSYFGDKKDPLKINENEYITSQCGCWIEGTTRGFIENLDLYIGDLSENDQEIIFFDSKFAWGIEATELREICKKYNIDMRIYAFERGMEFNQEIEIIDGEITIDRKITFDDYRWKCPFPDIGG